MQVLTRYSSNSSNADLLEGGGRERESLILTIAILNGAKLHQTEIESSSCLQSQDALQL